MFEFLKKKQNLEQQTKEEENDILASITYYVSTNNETMVDIGLNDYDETSINAICILLDTLSKDGFYLETIEMLKNGLIAEKQEQVLVKILTYISERSRKKIIEQQKDKSFDEPCVKPSDMIQ